VSRLFLACSRDFGRAHVAVYAEALAEVDDEDGAAAGRELMRWVSWDNPPSVRMVLESVAAIRARRAAARPALAEAAGPPMPPEVVRANLAALRQRRPACAGARPIAASLPRLSVTAHDFGDHGHCGPDCPDHPPTPENGP
jgi:hypothetical protein